MTSSAIVGNKVVATAEEIVSSLTPNQTGFLKSIPKYIFSVGCEYCNQVQKDLCVKFHDKLFTNFKSLVITITHRFSTWYNLLEIDSTLNISV